MKHSSEEKERQNYINTPGKIPLHAFRKQFRFHINYGIADIDIHHLIRDMKEGKIFIDWDVYLPSKNMNLQRGFVWTLEQKQELILSVLKGITIPPITVIQLRQGTRDERRIIYKIIDGKQRLSTLIDFVKEGFWVPLNHTRFWFDDLSNQAKREIYDCVRSNIAYEYEDAPISDEDKIAWFEIINFAGTPQDVEHIKKLKS